MIAISTEQGSLIKLLSMRLGAEEIYGFHPKFGFISERASNERARSRKLHGLNSKSGLLCRFRIGAQSVAALEGCSVEATDGRRWKLATPVGTFMISETAEFAPTRVGGDSSKEESQRWAHVTGATLAAIVFLFFYFAPAPEMAPVAPEVLEPLTVKIMPEVQKAVSVPMAMPKQLQQVQDKQARRAVEQNLGFLGLLGRKDLTKALGGAPTAIKDASPGAGAGGNEGSGGELLVGLGQGVKRTTVGNSGVAGLGGVGTKGAGGGAGGYGNTMVGSGEGRALSSIPLSQEMVLEGGLDKSVIQATIAKYLSQVRACYEAGLREVPGLSGMVTMSFEIGSAGNVNFARVGKSSLGNPGVEQCISTRMLGWQFPKPLGGVNVKVNYPFALRPVGT